MKTITIAGYPATVEIKTSIKLPKFKYGCEVRTKIAVRALSKIEYSAPHLPSDFIVETIEVVPGGEVWHLGS